MRNDEMLREILRCLREIRADINWLKGKMDEITPRPEQGAQPLPAKGENRPEAGTGVLDVMTLLSLPDHLRITIMALSELGDATADQVSKRTGRARAIESSYLNQLVRMGYLEKRRVGRKVCFLFA